MELSVVYETTILYCIASYFVGWCFSYGLNLLRRFLLISS